MNKEQLHDFRKQIDACIKKAELDFGCPEEAGQDYTRRLEKVLTNLQLAKMWVGKLLEVLGSELPEEFRDEAKQ